MDDCGFILGILLTYLDHRGPLSVQVDRENDDPALEVREKWMSQIENTVSELHKHGIIWGDAKAENALLDANGDVWVIDFGGGYTRGWVEKEEAETMAGDMTGLTKIRKYLTMN